MGQSFFIWKGIDCRAMGCKTSGHAPIIRPEERAEHVTIPGRSGDLTFTEGEDIYNSYIQTVSFMVQGAMNVRNVYRWLRGSGYVIFSGEPDKQQEARIIGAVTLNRHSYNLDWWTGEVQFYCQPLKEMLTSNTVTITSSGLTVRNNGDVPCKPLYKVTVSGSGSGKTVKVKTAGTGIPTNEITITSMTGGDIIWIDSDTMEVWNSDKTALLTMLSSGSFPVMGIGNNTVTFSGCSSILIDRRERYL